MLLAAAALVVLASLAANKSAEAIQASVLFSGATATGFSTAIQPQTDLKSPQVGLSLHTVEAVFTPAAFTALKFRLENALGTSNTTAPTVGFETMQPSGDYACTAAELAAGACTFTISNFPAVWVRANITTYTPVSGAPAVTIYYLPGRN